MAISGKLQAARKQAQKARLKKKGDPDYPEFYAKQPLQKIKAAENEEIRVAKHAVKDAEEDLRLAQVTGKGLKEAQDALPVKRLIVQRLVEQKRRNKHPGVRLTSASGGES